MSGNKNSGRRRLYTRVPANLTDDQVEDINIMAQASGEQFQATLRRVVDVGLMELGPSMRP